jgi:hypothetical protein
MQQAKEREESDLQQITLRAKTKQEEKGKKKGKNAREQNSVTFVC